MIDSKQASQIFEEFGILTNVGGYSLGVSEIADAGSGMSNPLVVIDQHSEVPTNDELARILLHLPSLFDGYIDEYVAKVMSTNPASDGNWRPVILRKSINDGWHFRKVGVQMPWFPTPNMRPLPPWTLDEMFEHIKGVPKIFDRQLMELCEIVEANEAEDKICAICNQSLTSRGYYNGMAGVHICSASHALLQIGQRLLHQPELKITSVRAIDERFAAIAYTDGESTRIQLYPYRQSHNQGISLNGNKLSGDFCLKSYPLNTGANVVTGDYGNVSFIV